MSESPSIDIALRLRGVRRSYRSGVRTIVALADADLEVGRGEFVAITGPSGSGKSTLLHVAGGLLVPDTGTVEVMGEPIVREDDTASADARRRLIGFVFQFFNLLPNLRAWENVALPGVLNGVGLSDMRERALDLLDRVGLAEVSGERPSELSGGQMQRVAVARALLLDPPFLLADEPTGNLDQASGAEVVELLRGTARRGVAVVMVTHDPKLAQESDWQVQVLDGAVAEVVRS